MADDDDFGRTLTSREWNFHQAVVIAVLQTLLPRQDTSVADDIDAAFNIAESVIMEKRRRNV